MSEHIKTITDASFEEDVIRSGKPVLVDFWAEWCGPCRALTPVLEEVAESHADNITFAKINIDDNPRMPAEYGVMSIPTLILFKNGQVVGMKMGLQTKSQLAAFLKAIVDLDKIIGVVDLTIRTLISPENRTSSRELPGKLLPELPLSPTQKKHIAGLMRVNHAGEVAAQGLYQGQSLTAKLSTVKQQMTDAAAEETDHLAWCEQRLRDLGSQPSILNPVWYFGSLMMGALAGLAGDRFSLGFVAETEQQVSAHLQKHLKNLPPEDKKTRLILEKMQEDESLHAETARHAGGLELPVFIQQLMRGVSKLMTKTSYYL